MNDINQVLFENRNQSIKLKVQFIEKMVVDYYKIDPQDLRKKKRHREIVLCRQIICFLVRKNTSWSSTQIGKYMGGKDHATILHSIKVIYNQMSYDEHFRENMNLFQAKIDVVKTKDQNEVLQKTYYYINLNECITSQVDSDKSLVFTGYTPEEVKEMLTKLGMELNVQEHVNTNIYILEPKSKLVKMEESKIEDEKIELKQVEVKINEEPIKEFEEQEKVDPKSIGENIIENESTTYNKFISDNKK